MAEALRGQQAPLQPVGASLSTAAICGAPTESPGGN